MGLLCPRKGEAGGEDREPQAPRKPLPETGRRAQVVPEAHRGDSAGRRSDPKRPSPQESPGVPTGDRKPGPRGHDPPAAPAAPAAGHTRGTRGARGGGGGPAAATARPPGRGSRERAGTATTSRPGVRGRRPWEPPTRPAPPTFRANFSCVLLLKICRTLPLMPSPRTCVVTL